MKRVVIVAFLVSFMSAGASSMAAAQSRDHIPRAIAQAVADPGRPNADKARDVNRKPADIIAFAGLKRGDKIADLLPGGGYFTRIFSKVVGAKGHVYAVVPDEIMKVRPRAADSVNAIAADKAYGNTTVLVMPVAAFKLPTPVNMVWTSDNYHDLKLPVFGPADTVALDRAIYNALTPGGVFLVIDHAAAAGSGTRDCGTLHRIDPEVVKSEATAAGFVLEGTSNALRNPNDDHTAKVFDPTICGRTDQFIFKFRKPKHS